ncbi:MAG: hypothetical protein R3211_07635 [Balneolaceae bacterium]|nr:hypothetical protein [Balneolaceae bacterium]
MKYRITQIIFAFSLLLPVSTTAQGTLDSLATLTGMDHAYPNWSPDGSKITFMSDMLEDNNEIYVMNADGSGLKRLTANRWNDLAPVWSPDGDKILFESIRESGKHDVYLMDADGSNLRNVTNHPSSLDNHPKFSPDGKWIVFNSSRDTPEDWSEDKYDYEIYEMKIDGTGLKRLTENLEGWDSYPSISPDGTKLLWRRIVPVAGRDRGNSEVFIAERDGSNPKNLSEHPGFDGYPAWSRDGSNIVFASARNEMEERKPPKIFIMNPDGTDIRQVTKSSPDLADVRPWFSPDGRKIVFNRIYIGEGRTEILTGILPD